VQRSLHPIFDHFAVLKVDSSRGGVAVVGAGSGPCAVDVGIEATGLSPVWPSITQTGRVRRSGFLGILNSLRQDGAMLGAPSSLAICRQFQAGERWIWKWLSASCENFVCLYACESVPECQLLYADQRLYSVVIRKSIGFAAPKIQSDPDDGFIRQKAIGRASDVPSAVSLRRCVPTAVEVFGPYVSDGRFKANGIPDWAHVIACTQTLTEVFAELLHSALTMHPVNRSGHGERRPGSQLSALVRCVRTEAEAMGAAARSPVAPGRLAPRSLERIEPSWVSRWSQRLVCAARQVIQRAERTDSLTSHGREFVAIPRLWSTVPVQSGAAA
jgi:hypothetical protein